MTNQIENTGFWDFLGILYFFISKL